MIVQVCIGSSCHIKGSRQVIEKMKQAIEQYHLSDEVALAGSFCTGKCNRVGVTVTVDDQIITGVTPEGFDAFFREQILSKLGK
jgi:NADH:ubiquinone oxidoreductase subunit E